MSHKQPNDLEKAGEESRQGFFSEMWAFLCHNKKWWLLPILLILLLFAVLIIVSGTSLAPFIYTLF